MSTDVQGPPPGEADEIASHSAEIAAPEVIADSLGQYARIWWTRVRGGESGALPVIAGLVIIVIYFQVRNSLFLSSGNLVNLMGQSAWIVMLGLAEVFVLLLGEIDLSIGYTSAIGATIALWMLSPPHPLPWILAALAGMAVPAAFSALEAVIITWLRLPSFVVTLAGYLAAEGLLLYLVNQAAPNSGGTIRLNSNVIFDLENGSISPIAGWIVTIVAVALAGGLLIIRDSRRRASNLAAPPASVTLLKVVVMAIAGLVVVLISNTDRGRGLTVLRGVPWVVLLVLVVVIIWSTLLSRTRFGRYVYAIGGNAEAARRAGINLTRVRIIAFTLSGATAGLMGLLYASYLDSVSNDVNGGQLVLYAVAAAVIGGASLFGGRGRMLGAVLGGLIVGVIYNGLYLLGLGPAAISLWTAGVLLAAVAVDSLARRNRPEGT